MSTQRFFQEVKIADRMPKKLGKYITLDKNNSAMMRDCDVSERMKSLWEEYEIVSWLEEIPASRVSLHDSQ